MEAGGSDNPPVARCDSKRITWRVLDLSAGEEGRKGNTGACRFLGVDRIYTMYLGDPNRSAVAQHLWDVFDEPQSTEPKVDDKGNVITKNFPGNYDACTGSADPRYIRVPLMRRPRTALTPDGKKFDGKNDYTRRRFCARIPGKAENAECDEYPFASTHQAIGVEGKMVDDTWVPSLNASLRYVPANQNGAAGRDLGAFHVRYRVFTGGTASDGGLSANHANYFYVKIRLGPPLASYSDVRAGASSTSIR